MTAVDSVAVPLTTASNTLGPVDSLCSSYAASRIVAKTQQFETVAMTINPTTTNLQQVDAESAGDAELHHGGGAPKGQHALRVLFLSSDTGGGHRASAESLANQFELLFPGTTYDLLDLATESYLPPYNSIVPYYKHLSAHPAQWKLLYGVSNSRAMERVVETNIKVMSVMCERSIRKRIKSYNPDVVVSVHPLQTSVPILSCAKISHETGKHLPMFTVVTDLGSAHCTWFANGIEKMFVGSKQIYKLARVRGIPEEKLVLVGLPIRYDFSVESESLGDRMSDQGRAYQREVRRRLALPSADRKTLLVMGGGEGVGSLSDVVNALYIELVKQGIDAVIMVVCGRNDVLKKSLEDRDWVEVFQKRSSHTKKSKSRGLFSTSMFPDLGGCGDAEITVAAGCIEAGGSFRSLRKILSSGSLRTNDSAVFIPSPTHIDTEEEKKEEKASRDPADGSIGVENKKPASSKKALQPSLTEDKVVLNDGEEPLLSSQEGNGPVQKSASIEANGTVDVVPIGFIKNMAEYMVASDVLISKAGPGTISEAAALSLPVMLTSFLPGQEEGNVDYVVEGGFGAFCQDTDPQAVAEEVALWLNNETKLKEMSEAAKKAGHPYAARDIVKQIGDSSLKWRELNHGHESAAVATTDDENEEIEVAKLDGIEVAAYTDEDSADRI